MKKLILAFLGILLVFVAISCWGSPKMKSLTFLVNDGPISPEYYSESVVGIIPNYDDRTLNVTFQQTYPYKTEESEFADFTTSGSIGGEFFDRYEQIVEYVLNYESVETEPILGAGVFLVELQNLKGKVYSIETTVGAAIEGMDELNQFYLEVKDLLTEEAPV